MKGKIDMTNENDFGVRVGDIFEASWGYDQTNVDHYQVVGVTGKSVRIREVTLPKISVEATGPMAAYNTYKLPKGEILKSYPNNSIFIKNQTKGDLKRCHKDWNGDGVIIDMGHHIARLIPRESETVRAYESWYA